MAFVEHHAQRLSRTLLFEGTIQKARKEFSRHGPLHVDPSWTSIFREMPWRFCGMPPCLSWKASIPAKLLADHFEDWHDILEAGTMDCFVKWI